MSMLKKVVTVNLITLLTDATGSLNVLYKGEIMGAFYCVRGIGFGGFSFDCVEMIDMLGSRRRRLGR
jgi:hypothetical protein